MPLASGQLNAVTLGSYASGTFNSTKAILKVISLSAIPAPGVAFGSGDKLKLQISVRIASSSTHANAHATVWFNMPDATSNNSSHLHAKIGGSDDKYFLVSGFLLKKNVPGSGGISGIQSVDAYVSQRRRRSAVQHSVHAVRDLDLHHALTRGRSSRGRRRAKGVSALQRAGGLPAGGGLPSTGRGY